MKRQIASTVIGAPLSSGVGVGIAGSAWAASRTCPSGNACLWGDPSCETGVGSWATRRWIKLERRTSRLTSFMCEGAPVVGDSTASSIANDGTSTGESSTAHFSVWR